MSDNFKEKYEKLVDAISGFRYLYDDMNEKFISDNGETPKSWIETDYDGVNTVFDKWSKSIDAEYVFNDLRNIFEIIDNFKNS